MNIGILICFASSVWFLTTILNWDVNLIRSWSPCAAFGLLSILIRLITPFICRLIKVVKGLLPYINRFCRIQDRLIGLNKRWAINCRSIEVKIRILLADIWSVVIRKEFINFLIFFLRIHLKIAPSLLVFFFFNDGLLHLTNWDRL